MRISELAQAVQQPSPDAGPFADVYGKVAGVVAWGVPAISVLMIIGLGVWKLIQLLGKHGSAGGW